MERLGRPSRALSARLWLVQLQQPGAYAQACGLPTPNLVSQVLLLLCLVSVNALRPPPSAVPLQHAGAHSAVGAVALIITWTACC